MLIIPPRLEAEFEGRLLEKAIPSSARGFYKKWLRYYLDFCHKYRFQYAQRESLSRFLQKLAEKGQTESQRDQAAKAIELFFQIIREKTSAPNSPPGRGIARSNNAPSVNGRHLSVQEPSLKSSSLDSSSPRFQAFTKSKPPASLSSDDVKEFLTFLAVKRKVSSSTQNQAFTASISMRAF